MMTMIEMDANEKNYTDNIANNQECIPPDAKMHGDGRQYGDTVQNSAESDCGEQRRGPAPAARENTWRDV